VPSQFELEQNYPNPFNPSTRVKFSIPKEQNVSLKVYDVLGKETAKLIEEKLKAGTYEVKFSGEMLSSGMYFYTLKTNDFVQTKKMILIK